MDHGGKEGKRRKGSLWGGGKKVSLVVVTEGWGTGRGKKKKEGGARHGTPLFGAHLSCEQKRTESEPVCPDYISNIHGRHPFGGIPLRELPPADHRVKRKKATSCQPGKRSGRPWGGALACVLRCPGTKKGKTPPALRSRRAVCGERRGNPELRCTLPSLDRLAQKRKSDLPSSALVHDVGKGGKSLVPWGSAATTAWDLVRGKEKGWKKKPSADTRRHPLSDEDL